MATLRYEDVHPDHSSCSQDIGEGPPGPYVLPYMDENNPGIGVLWLNADEWVKVQSQQTPFTSEQTLQQPPNGETNPHLPLTEQASPQVSGLVTGEPRSPEAESGWRQEMIPRLKTTVIFARNYRDRPRKMGKKHLAKPDRWREIQWVIFGEVHDPFNVQCWDHNTKVNMINNSELLWESDHPAPPGTSTREPVTVAVFKHVNRGLWCEVASTVSSQKLYILDPHFM